MKPYVKPELFYESFEMNQSIAACVWDFVQLKNPNDCKAYLDSGKNYTSENIPHTGMFIFAGDVCEGNKVSNPEIYCYTNGTDDLKTFQS
ncbi:MAG: hypothetical protein IKU17_02925 [Clostridia bacterium]|nr:hypothetical protein [Clostridia bacterium]